MSESPAEADTGDHHLIATAGVFVLYAATVAGGVLLAESYLAAGLKAFEDAQRVSNSGIIFLEVLVATGVFLLAQRYGFGKSVLRVALILVFGYIVALVVGTTIPATLPGAAVLPIVVGAGLALVLWVYPEWWVLDVAAVVAGAGMIAQFGISLAPLPIVLLLVVMAVYDAYSVYVSGHMQSLAAGIGDLKLPMVFVVPTRRSFTLLDDGNVFEAATGTDDDDGSETGVDVSILGLGDAIFPGMMAVSAGVYVDAPTLVAGVPLNAPAVGALAGGLVGMVALQYLATNVEGAHAGLPALNGGVLLGYLVGAFVAGIGPVTALGLA
ncbi:MAG: presenilin family intramembrane aspartyl protease PSH [Halobacteriaceae archaeon]